MLEHEDKELLDILQSTKIDTIPEGWFTCKEWAVKWNLSPPRTSQLLRNGIDEGIIERTKFRVQRDRGVMPIDFYKKK